MSQISKLDVAIDLEAFVRNRFEVESDDTFFNTELNLWEEGYIDSVGVIELISYLETTYSIEIPRVLLFDPEFTSITGIAERIVRLL